MFGVMLDRVRKKRPIPQIDTRNNPRRCNKIGVLNASHAENEETTTIRKQPRDDAGMARANSVAIA